MEAWEREGNKSKESEGMGSLFIACGVRYWHVGVSDIVKAASPGGSRLNASQELRRDRSQTRTDFT